MFQKGNQLAKKKRKFEDAIHKALSVEDYQALRRIAHKVLALAEEGERWAVELLRDTLDGKPAQQVIATDTEGRPLAIALVTYDANAGPDDSVQVYTQELPAPNPEEAGQRH
jgi:hypothetical protein